MNYPITLGLKHSNQKTNPSMGGAGNEQDNTRNYVLKLAARLKDFIEFNPVVLPMSQNLDEVIRYINQELQPEVVIDHHLNGGGGQGTLLFCYTQGESLRAATIIYEEISKVTPWTDRGIKDGMIWNGEGLGIIKYTNCPALLIELVFQDSKEQMDHWLNNMDEYIEAEVKALCRIYNVTYRRKEGKGVGIIYICYGEFDYLLARVAAKIKPGYIVMEDDYKKNPQPGEKIKIGGSWTPDADTKLLSGKDGAETAKKVFECIFQSAPCCHEPLHLD